MAVRTILHSTLAGPPPGRWSTRLTLPGRLGLVSDVRRVPFGFSSPPHALPPWAANGLLC